MSKDSAIDSGGSLGRHRRSSEKYTLEDGSSSDGDGVSNGPEDVARNGTVDKDLMLMTTRKLDRCDDERSGAGWGAYHLDGRSHLNSSSDLEDEGGVLSIDSSVEGDTGVERKSRSPVVPTLKAETSEIDLENDRG